MIAQLRKHADELGFVLCGVAPAIASPDYLKLVQWIESGYAGDMNYFRERLTAYQHPRGVLPGAKSIMVLAYPYDQGPPRDVGDGTGRVARYVWRGEDYHDVIHPKLKQLCRLINDLQEGSHARGIVDTAPLLEREVAELAGLGWRGKNTLLLNKRLGSYFFLACVLVDVQLPIDQPHLSTHCGSCTACLDACPTDAFPKPGVLDATRCISYLTIEHRGSIDVALRPQIGDWLFGCDICQEVCPWNRKPTERASQKMAQPALASIELSSLFAMTDDRFRERFRQTPLWRARRRGILRNAAIVLGNQKKRDALPALVRGLSDVESIVREASAWAVGQIGGRRSLELLRERYQLEAERSVKDEIEAAVRTATPS